ncbi:GTPase HflX [Peptoniphilus equinus]|uniref:GTPase HflX n=1 Tax=Peptoniphilus equinus TaxID=3016343 RepID=A0ABY7QR78_9FIRM|nr:GTPase HflX [Peptoniphilus equinus]WBW49293.1 GTPase HflX [Peptoniphilus equinus]
MEIIQNNNRERAILVGTDLGAYPNSLETSIHELEELVKAAGGDVVGTVTQRLEKYSPKFLIGAGKIKEIKALLEPLEANVVIFNDELSGIQLRNIEDELKVKILDRTNLILDIFAIRASTYEAKLQVELAQLEYQLPRLLGIDGWSRTGGGIGTRGPGEQIIETDRRRILREIHAIKEKLKKAERSRATQRQHRTGNAIPVVSLVGYTNAGKSTLLNRLKSSDSKEVFVKNMLFATLDPSSRKAKLKNGMDFIISDTVGFVSKLPTKLVEAFKSTLEEIKYSDLILHVIDASSTDLEIQYQTTMSILEDLHVDRSRILTVFNKMDRVDEELYIDPTHGDNRIYISAKKDASMDVVLEAIETHLPERFIDVHLKFGYADQPLLSELLSTHHHETLDYKDDGIYVDVVLKESELARYQRFVYVP